MNPDRGIWRSIPAHPCQIRSLESVPSWWWTGSPVLCPLALQKAQKPWRIYMYGRLTHLIDTFSCAASSYGFWYREFALKPKRGWSASLSKVKQVVPLRYMYKYTRLFLSLVKGLGQGENQNAKSGGKIFHVSCPLRNYSHYLTCLS